MAGRTRWMHRKFGYVWPERAHGSQRRLPSEPRWSDAGIKRATEPFLPNRRDLRKPGYCRATIGYLLLVQTPPLPQIGQPLASFG